MIIFARNAILEALNENRTIEKALVSTDRSDVTSKDIISKLKEKNVLIKYEKREVIDKICAGKNHRGIVLFVSDYKYCEIDDILAVSKNKNKAPFILILDEILDPHNFGSIIRTAECAGVDGIIIPKNRAVGVTETVEAVSQGATSYVKIAKVTNINNAIEYLKNKNIFVYGAEANGESVYKTNMTGPIAVVIGSEGNGIKTLTKKLCDGIVSLPILGKINSLNASMATVAILYECIRQREL